MNIKPFASNHPTQNGKFQQQSPGFLGRVFLKISQNSQKNTCTRVSFIINLQAPNSQENTWARVSLIRLQTSDFRLQTWLWHRCFPVNLAPAKFLSKSFQNSFFIEHLRWLLLKFKPFSAPLGNALKSLLGLWELTH